MATIDEQSHAGADEKPRRRGIWWRLAKIIGRLFVLYLVLVLLMMWLETLLLFPTWQIPEGDWHPADIQFEDVEFQAADGTRLNGWYFAHPDPKAHVLYCHGNGEDLSHMGQYLSSLRDEYQVSVFAFDYRGYGKSEGKPNEEGLLADGRAAQTWLATRAGIAPNQVVIWGRSIGGGVAVPLAAELGARGLILERTFSSVADVAAYHYPWLPVRSLMRNRFDALAQISRYRGPLLQSHGTTDDVVPFEFGKKLFDAAASRDKHFVAMTGVTHNAPNSEEYYTYLRRFLEQLP